MYDVEFYDRAARQWVWHSEHTTKAKAEQAISEAIDSGRPHYSNLSGVNPRSDWRIMVSKGV